VDSKATLVCKAPEAKKLPAWCAQWAASQHQKQITAHAAALLVELVGPEMGLLDQELLKLALYVGDRKRIDVEDVDKLVGRSRAESVWKILEAAGAGNAKEALTVLDRLLDQGEEPLRLLGALSSQLRQLAQAARLTVSAKVPLHAALEEVGVRPFNLGGSERQLKHLGRQRALRLYDWLLDVNQGVKGGSQLPPRTQLERLVARLAQKV